MGPCQSAARSASADFSTSVPHGVEALLSGHFLAPEQIAVAHLIITLLRLREPSMLRSCFAGAASGRLSIER